MAWTAEQIPDLTGSTAVVTGANSGLGWQTALQLARHGAHVVLACRSVDRGRAAERRLHVAAPGSSTELRALDLADLESVRAFAEGLDEPVDLLVNNAGVMALPRETTAQGFERQLGTNHLGHFALTGLLLDRLLATDAPRVVTVSSVAHRMGRIAFDDLQSERRYQRWKAYGQSKLANLLFAFELQRRADAAGAHLTSTAAHPGYSATHLQFQANNITGTPIDRVVNRVMNLVIAQSDERGALPILHAAVEDLPGGTYVGPDGPGEMRGSPTVVTPTARARSEQDAARLWEVSEELTGVRYDFSATPAAASG